jgi:hypothetical protein
VKKSSIRLFWVAGVIAGLLCGCGGGAKRKKLELTKEHLEVHKHVLVVGAGPELAKLEVGTAGKVMMKGLSKIVEKDPDSSFVESLKKIGLVPLPTAMEAAVAQLQEMGWQTTVSKLHFDSPGKKYKKVKLPEGVCEEAVAAGADSALILYERFIIDVGATNALGRTDLWAHFFECQGKELLWRGKKKKDLSLKRFIFEAAKAAIEKKKKTLEDFLGSLRRLVEDNSRKLMASGLSR